MPSAKKKKHCTLYVEGMHCTACEALIETTLQEKHGVTVARASTGEQRVEVEYIGDKPDLAQLNSQFASLGYKFEDRPSPPLVQVNKAGQLEVNTIKLRNSLRVLIIAIIALTLILLLQNTALAGLLDVSNSSSLGTFFILGLVAGISGCAAIVGGLLLALQTQWQKQNSWKPQILFHGGRLFAFAILGGILGIVGGGIWAQSSFLFSIISLIAVGIMLILGLQMLQIPWAMRIRLAPPKKLSKKVNNSSENTSQWGSLLIGAGTFFLPCGFTLSAQTSALTSGSFIQGSLIMLAFVLGTLPLLLIITATGKFFGSRPHFVNNFNAVAGVIVIFFALQSLNGQLNVLGLPSLSDLLPGSINSQQPGFAPVVSGKQVISITADAHSYIPTSSTKIHAGIPSQLNVDNQGAEGCGVFVAASGLIDDFVALKPGINSIDLGEPRVGEYKLTCSQGRVDPIVISVV